MEDLSGQAQLFEPLFSIKPAVAGTPHMETELFALRQFWQKFEQFMASTQVLTLSSIL